MPLNIYSVTITQFGRCRVKIENNSKIKICSFFLVLGKGMPDIETLGIFTIKCNTRDTKEADEAEKHRTNTAKSKESTSEQQYINMRQEAETPEKCYTNTVSI